MNKFLHIRPALGLSLRDPSTKELLPPEGGKVERSPFWIRRLKDGDVTEVKQAPAKPAKKGGE